MKVFSKRILINILLTIALAILITSGSLAYNQLQRLLNTNTMVLHTHKIIETSYQLQNKMIDAESRINFYLLNHNRNILKEVPGLIASVKISLQELKNLTTDNAIQQQRIAIFEKLINEKLNLINETYIAIMNNKILPESNAKNLFRREQIKIEANNLTHIFNIDMQSLIFERHLQSLIDARKINIYIIELGCISIILFILSIILLNYHLKQLNRAEEKQRKTEKALLKSNENFEKSDERFKLATQGSNVGIWDWIPDTDNVYYSEHFLRMLGYTSDEFPESLNSFNKILHPDDYEKVWGAVADHLNNHIPFQIEYRLRTKHDNYRWFQATGRALRDEHDKPIRMSGSIIDITDRKHYEMMQNVQYSVSSILSEDTTLEDKINKIILIHPSSII